MSEDNGNAPQPPPQQPTSINLNMQLSPNGVLLTFPAQLAIDNATMKQMVMAYLQVHPEFVQEIAKQALAQKRQELAIIKAIDASRIRE